MYTAYRKFTDQPHRKAIRCRDLILEGADTGALVMGSERSYAGVGMRQD